MDIVIAESVTTETVDRVVQEILTKKSADKAGNLFVYINTHGGELAAGYALFEIFRECGRKVITCAYQEIMSCGIILFLAGEERLATENVKFMIHEPRHIYPDDSKLDSKDYRKYLKEIEGDAAKYFKLIAKRTKITAARIRKQIKEDPEQEWNFDTAAAMKMGFVTKIGLPVW